MQRQRLFLGLRDFDTPRDFPMRNWIGPEGLLMGLRLRDYVFGYVGSVGPLPLWMALFNGGMSPPDAAGYSASRLGVWRRQWDQFTAFSFQPQVLSTVTPQIHFQQAQRGAQIRVRVGDLSQVQLAPLANRMVYSRSRETTLGNLRLIHAMREQLHVPGEDCRAAAELLVDARLVCPLGGQYVYRQTPDGVGYWTSTVLEAAPEPGTAPAGFQAPPLDWFRGLTGDGILSAEKVSVHAEIDMQLPEKK
jgi:Zn finger protein HypA/HybF involved in hydrogenase expression